MCMRSVQKNNQVLVTKILLVLNSKLNQSLNHTIIFRKKIRNIVDHKNAGVLTKKVRLLSQKIILRIKVRDIKVV